MLYQEKFIEDFVTQFLATWAANQFRAKTPGGVADYDWLKNAPLQEAQLIARHVWYLQFQRFGPPSRWR